MDDDIGICDQCKRPLIRIDRYGEEFVGCVACNRWGSSSSDLFMELSRAATLKAMKEAEQGWQKAIDKIAERAGLTKGPDGTWRDPSMSEAA